MFCLHQTLKSFSILTRGTFLDIRQVAYFREGIKGKKKKNWLALQNSHSKWRGNSVHKRWFPKGEKTRRHFLSIKVSKTLPREYWAAPDAKHVKSKEAKKHVRGVPQAHHFLEEAQGSPVGSSSRQHTYLGTLRAKLRVLRRQPFPILLAHTLPLSGGGRLTQRKQLTDLDHSNSLEL